MLTRKYVQKVAEFRHAAERAEAGLPPAKLWFDAWKPTRYADGFGWICVDRLVELYPPEPTRPYELFVGFAENAENVVRPTQADVQHALRWMVGLEDRPVREEPTP